MPRRYLPGVLVMMLFAVVLTAAPAVAGHPILGRLKGHRHPPPGCVADPWHLVAPPTSYYRTSGLCANRDNWSGYGFGVPTYRWGYFGARYRPVCITHKGYYGTYTQWGYRSGY